ncbi:hypothetical protein [Halomonas daqiaonensis]|nr:hypothetical protein [Halomonas daqiaonensis]
MPSFRVLSRPAIAAMATILILLSTLLLATMELLRRRSERLKGNVE